MTAKAKDSTLATRSPSPLVLFGIDNRGKPKGARFGKEHASLAMKAATQLQLQVLADMAAMSDGTSKLRGGKNNAPGRSYTHR